ncbi:GMC family oxidoreductase [Mycolicibacterium goodii]|uniref:FAD-dependent oxidoreductase n=1 Tax=Mycolicibacterium goodii TaxID=134601 RepID=A0ABS6HJR3_MYCGD|nr:GMC oxidoreductase [Mycolicibacterium goodii]OKH63370.1 choline oxidase [Mycobacterium sp. SWH-M5]MBU8813479.1 FAD-dependent oxidoreductase [Mycolicibacterium goodii]MBU8817225.1 FAD-dependent oxidoreductase [Mycolicibacterium goodii]MBU8821934.1 FAD-dependent oxidoreductase [Mycolicibacterium goodii]MBU8828429.1 FAD-dependent oxidoreductase [Mycolicibacterium goodii]
MSDYLIIGGGTAGCIVASRLSQNPDVTVTVLESGPSDRNEPRARDIRRWAQMLESEYDLDYRSVPQVRGNSGIRQARMRILGGCSTANTMITWRPLAADLDEWAAMGVTGWDPATVHAAFDRLLVPVQPVADKDRNPYVGDVVASARRALDLPARHAWNSDPDFAATGVGAGFFEIGYTPHNHLRSSTSVHYLHDAVTDRENLVVEHGQHAERLLIEDGRVTGVIARDDTGDRREFRADREVIVCCGAIDSPKLLQLSGIGPAEVLAAAGVSQVVDAPGVGENLMDHAEGLIVWEVGADVPDTCATGWDAGAAVRLSDDGPARPDVLMHFPVEAVADHAVAYGVTMPGRIVSIAPNVAKPSSRGRVWITSSDPSGRPSIDYRYFTDPDGHDEAMLIAGIRLARRIAATEPMAGWLVREVFPGPDAQSDEALSEALRATHQTVYHVSGTCRMGADDDPMAVCDSRLRVRGVDGLRIVDASVFPTIPSVNPVGTIMAVAEQASALLLADHHSAYV